MSRYAPADEEAIRTGRQVHDWMQSGLLDAGRAAAIERDLQTNHRRTNLALRVVLFVFTTVVIQSGVGLVVVLIKPDDVDVASGLAFASGVGSFLIAEFLVARFRLYRFGIEEACAVWSVGLMATGAVMAASIVDLRGDPVVVIGLLTGAIGALVVYVRLGLLYALLGAVACASAAPFFLGLSEPWARALAAILLLIVHLASGSMRRQVDEDYPGDDYGAVEAAAWVGTYALINLKLTNPFSMPGAITAPAFYWATYVVIWILPVVGLYRGVREKHHWMIRTSLLIALATLLTNKAYLGFEHRPWDPILLGIVLVGAALGVRRWLSLGVDGQRHGFTPLRLLSSDQRSVARIGLATAALTPNDSLPDRSEPPTLGGGASGGAGASSRF